jgi:hypothetical protein
VLRMVLARHRATTRPGRKHVTPLHACKVQGN